MEVLNAARLGDTGAVSALLAAGADVNGRSDQGCVTAARVYAPEGRRRLRVHRADRRRYNLRVVLATRRPRKFWWRLAPT